MASTHPIPASPGGPPTPLEAARAVEVTAEQALVPMPHGIAEAGAIQLSAAMARLPSELDVSVPVRDFRVRNLLVLEAGQILGTDWGHGADLPLSSGEVQLAWSEFEVVDTALAVRVTRLA